jgi:predicted NUDIX family NTP pyrophosphohydrolase
MKQSAGTLLYRRGQRGLEVLIVHPSGSYNRKAAWSIPKGEPNAGEALEVTARRETLEETGVAIDGPVVSLGHIDYTKSKKRVHCFAAPLPDGQTPRCAQWEIDRAEMMTVDEAKRLIHADQAAFIDRLVAHLGTGAT